MANIETRLFVEILLKYLFKGGFCKYTTRYNLLVNFATILYFIEKGTYMR